MGGGAVGGLRVKRMRGRPAEKGGERLCERGDSVCSVGDGLQGNRTQARVLQMYMGTPVWVAG